MKPVVCVLTLTLFSRIWPKMPFVIANDPVLQLKIDRPLLMFSAMHLKQKDSWFVVTRGQLTELKTISVISLFDLQFHVIVGRILCGMYISTFLSLNNGPSFHQNCLILFFKYVIYEVLSTELRGGMFEYKITDFRCAPPQSARD